MPPSRRSPRASGRQRAEDKPAPVQEAEEFPATPDPGIDVVQPEASSETASASRPSGRSSRRTAASSSSSQQANASGSSKQMSSRRKGGGAFKLIFKLLLLAIVLGGGGYALWEFVLKTTPEMAIARKALDEAKLLVKGIESSIQNRQPQQAWEAYHKVEKIIEIPELAYAKEPIDIQAPALSSPQMAGRAIDISKSLKDVLKAQIEKVERDQQASANLAKLLEQFAKLRDIDDAALVNLEKNSLKFMDNPVEPEAGRKEDFVKDYPNEISDIKVRMQKIDLEKDRRHKAITSEPERKAHLEAEGLIKQEKFKDALAKVDEFQRQFPEAKFDNVREFVQAAAKGAWESAKTYADNNYKTFTAPGTSENFRQEALINAKRRMQEVIDRFGLDEYIDQAKKAMADYQR